MRYVATIQVGTVLALPTTAPAQTRVTTSHQLQNLPNVNALLQQLGLPAAAIRNGNLASNINLAAAAQPAAAPEIPLRPLLLPLFLRPRACTPSTSPLLPRLSLCFRSTCGALPQRPSCPCPTLSAPHLHLRPLLLPAATPTPPSTRTSPPPLRPPSRRPTPAFFAPSASSRLRSPRSRGATPSSSRICSSRAQRSAALGPNGLSHAPRASSARTRLERRRRLSLRRNRCRLTWIMRRGGTWTRAGRRWTLGLRGRWSTTLYPAPPTLFPLPFLLHIIFLRPNAFSARLGPPPTRPHEDRPCSD
ncbi:hypothetical protein DFH08DRAFT_197752 [Mycena albidolilacea]|uniref:Uncharacterized protein n=1 Tax=Mycena albidolilacea TaxID=1033008 RepID=A0AAD7EPZ6_9AGAR|nr:hypothetical protein DFH08DRAFT_197752 [Mycena albidolilacea]